MRGAAYVIRGDARRLPLPDASVDLVVTSPPYFALRSYTDGGEHYEGQVGDEETPDEYVASLVACTREWLRVLKPEGSLFVNLGDKYASARRGPDGSSSSLSNGAQPRRAASTPAYDVPRKSLLGLPWRYALACIDTTRGVPVEVARGLLADVASGELAAAVADRLLAEYDAGGARAGLGLTLRAEIVWSKPNGLPESVTDRVRRSHETWFHLVARPRYYSAVDELREPAATSDPASPWYRANGKSAGRRKPVGTPPGMVPQSLTTAPREAAHPLGVLPGSVWTVSTEPLSVPADLGVDHFAAFPLEWPRRIVLGWSPPGVCTECGEGRRPVVSRVRTLDGEPRDDLGTWDTGVGAPTMGAQGVGHWRFATTRSHEGYSCACAEPSAPTRPAVVLDPFGGTGTTALAAMALGRVGVSVDLSADYCRLARWRTSDRGEIARAMRLPKPEPERDGQGSLFG